METMLYLPKEEKWIHRPVTEFEGKNRELDPIYTLGITPPDPRDRNYILFNVWTEKTIKNLSTDKVVFFAKIYYCFRVKNEGKRPSVEFYYALVQRANEEFDKELSKRTQGTNLEGLRAFCPPLDFLHKHLLKTIDYWDRNDRYKSLN